MSSIFLYEPFYDFDRFFEHAMRPFVSPPTEQTANQQLDRRNAVAERALKPRMDLHEDSEKNLVSATFELPGVKKEDLQLEVRDGFLTIAAETKASTEREENGYAVRERRFGKVSRSLRLPRGVKDEDIKAAMADGVLTVTFPKRSAEEEPRKITIA